jgi:hypothetical protein
MLDKLGGVFAPKPSTGACREATTIDDDDDGRWRTPSGTKRGLCDHHRAGWVTAMRRATEAATTTTTTTTDERLTDDVRRARLFYHSRRSAQVSRVPSALLDSSQPLEVRVDVQGGHDHSHATLRQG